MRVAFGSALIGFTVLAKSAQRIAIASMYVPALKTMAGSAASDTSAKTICP